MMERSGSSGATWMTGMPAEASSATLVVRCSCSSSARGLGWPPIASRSYSSSADVTTTTLWPVRMSARMVG